MPIETAERIYAFVPLILIVFAGMVFLHLRRNYVRDDLFSNPHGMSEGQLKNVVAFGRMVMKNSNPLSTRWKEADRREKAAVAELARRGRTMPARRR